MNTMKNSTIITEKGIGLSELEMNRVATNLQRLLANYSIFYQNVRGYHWNVTGPQFFMLHEKFEELYTSINGIIDEVAERIRILGENPTSKFSEYLDSTDLEENAAVNAEQQIKEVVNGLKTLISVQREILEVAANFNDEGTASLMGDNISEHEKQVWMFGALLF